MTTIPKADSSTVVTDVANPWLDAMLQVARHYRLETSAERVRVMLDWQAGHPADVQLKQMARDMGMSLCFEKLDKGILDPWRLPVVAEFDNGQVGVIESVDNGQFAGVRLSGEQGVLQALPVAEVCARVQRVLLLRPEVSAPDARVDDYIKPYEANWFWKLALHDWRRYSDVMLASLIANVLALAAMLFSMQIYDRVIPAQSEPTLWVLFGGVVIAIVFEFCMRLSRTHLTDKIGKRADLRISDRVFGHALRIRTQDQSKSTGSFISQIRELEQVRELITSTTVNALADLPFFFLFLGVLWYVGGMMALVPLAILPLLIIPGLLAQRWLAKYSKEGMREASLRNAILIEAVQGNEDIKLLRAEQRFQTQWNHLNQVSADISMRQRFITGALMTWTQELQSLVYVLVILVGCFMVISGDLTTGALIGTSILSSRMIAPLAQLSGVMSRWQQAKVAREGLDELMKRPVDQPQHSKMLHRPVIQGDYRLEGVKFRYEQEQKQPALEIPGLTIKAGEKVAILGRNGAGKSTLLHLLSGLQAPQEGNVLLDSLNLSMIDPYDVRRDVGFLSQQASLFFGSLRDNIIMGKPMATDDEIIQALTLSGALSLVQSLPDGLDHLIREGGKGLSGGQRQMLLLARTLIRNPRVLLLDEPTAWLDELSEQHLIEKLLPWLEGRTLIVATHRPAVLKWVDRIIAVDKGRVVLDDTKHIVISQMSKPRASAA
ncbi:Type I secretion system ATPase, LssB family LapB [Pseudomonas chlororaphis subsp. piscium]|uniref:type I secretion system permease/ATPase n=1 Tax=Pseudomonas chlororaphis TaxID=587753 RepID=UPI0006A607BF|nr:type I secretion system permease/ATPase [Pseudomonas chlororaphis]AZC31816.1 Type I secretion system ATPase, LssB family LapB [Pseudomonas chlororaphis subsp. piscium]MBP5072423.1 type I secretion system permease/ATPase [Pseudomonas chlororaphis]QTT88394.1 type I secretion system permease/ATPase [Pseudomonas chlororaphis]WDG89582.1 type I secretion system permease/ATPase [Pseudomonas chlororaphis]SDS81707.1 ATP-binding cassette, subfamily C, LapB [Pseudomonas chlororaphis]